MKKSIKISLGIMTIAALLFTTACQKDLLESDQTGIVEQKSPAFKNQYMNTFYSHSVSVGNGVARAWIQTDKDDNPLSVGINLSEKALMSLPDHPMQYVLPLPKNKGHNFYTHVLFDWNPEGHEPPGIYDLPHFDFHFYTASNDLRMSIPGSFDMDTPVPAQYVPAPYFQLPGLVPAMGAHWVDPTSPEFAPEGTFSHTFILGSYQGEFIFWEPMITRAYLLTQPDEVFPIPQPAAYQKDGWYPEDYQISYSTNPGEYTVALINLQHHNGE